MKIAVVLVTNAIISLEIWTLLSVGKMIKMNSTIPVTPAPNNALLEKVKTKEINANTTVISMKRCSFCGLYPYGVLTRAESTSCVPKISIMSIEYIPLKFTSPKNPGALIIFGL